MWKQESTSAPKLFVKNIQSTMMGPENSNKMLKTNLITTELFI